MAQPVAVCKTRNSTSKPSHTACTNKTRSGKSAPHNNAPTSSANACMPPPTAAGSANKRG